MTPDLSKARVMVVGDEMRDIWIYGRIDRISPEAPVPVFVHERVEVKRGGAGNVIANLEALGCQAGSPLCRVESIKTRYIVGHQQVFRYDRDAPVLPDVEINDIFQEVTASADFDVLVLSDYGKGVLTDSLPIKLITWAKKNGIPVIVDPKGPWARYTCANLVTPNCDELPDLPSFARHTYNLGAVLLTRGAGGMTLYERDQEPLSIPATGPQVVDVTGAGDTVVAVMAAAIAIGLTLPEAMKLANAAAGVVVGKYGTATCSMAELEAACK